MRWKSVELDGKSERVAIHQTAQGVWIGSRSGTFFIESKEANLAAAGSGADDPNKIMAPLTGKVIAINTAADESVQPGDALVVLEAMKMEYKLTASAEGQVKAVNCSEGELVQQGQLLVELG